MSSFSADDPGKVHIFIAHRHEAIQMSIAIIAIADGKMSRARV